MYYHIQDNTNTWSKFDGHRFYSYRATCNNILLGQSLMVTGFTVIVLHAIISPYYNVLHEAISYRFHEN